VRRKSFIFWILDFVSTTAIAVILVIGGKYFWAFLIPALALFIFKIVEFQILAHEGYRSIQNQMNLLWHLLISDYPGLRCTLHVPVCFGFKLKQTFDYIQGGKSYGEGRKFSTKKGIGGMAYIQRGPQVENFDTEEEYREKMFNKYGYTEEEMKKRTRDRRSYLCYPILSDDNDKVIGILYFDSNISNTFRLNEDDKLLNVLNSTLSAIKANLM